MRSCKGRNALASRPFCEPVRASEKKWKRRFFSIIQIILVQHITSLMLMATSPSMWSIFHTGRSSWRSATTNSHMIMLMKKKHTIVDFFFVQVVKLQIAIIIDILKEIQRQKEACMDIENTRNQVLYLYKINRNKHYFRYWDEKGEKYKTYKPNGK